MKDNNIKNGIKEIKKITMTADEKERIFEYVTSSPISNVRKEITNPWSFHLFISVIKRNHFAYYAILPLIIILASGGIVFASEEVLPTSILYPVKVSIVEPVRGALTFSAEARAYYESDLATERLVEAETLATQGKLDKEKENQINTLLENHSKNLDEAISKIDQVKEPEKVDEIVLNFEAKMNAHAKVLDIITAEQENKQEDNQESNQDDNKEEEVVLPPQAPVLEPVIEEQKDGVEATVAEPEMRTMSVTDSQEKPVEEATVSEEALPMLKMQVMSGPTELENGVSNKARMSAEMISNKFKKKENQPIEKIDVEINKDIPTEEKIIEDKTTQYNKRKDAVKYIINGTIDNLNKVENLPSDKKKEIIENTNNTLEEAMWLLDEASKKEEGGDLDDAYNTLLDSEKSAKEADILLQTGLKIENKN
ncbi:MAG TPA: DUF5667 domain-containing protein [Candidatus Paceibacterota bacterium]|nr:DUF5667 domain-containing protein [Candidatus Paceibacterota bacterium]